MLIYLDIDNTICHTDQRMPSPEKYERARPITERITQANALYDQGHRIVYWTARGGASGIDVRELTERQLGEWGCKYHELRMDKPSFDLFVDDKACDCEQWLPVSGERMRRAGRVEKGWGYELIIENTEKYCGKILHFNTGCKFSMHYHILKQETWYVASGRYRFLWIDTATADMHERELVVGDIVTNYVGQPHQIICLEEGDIFEVSTQHFDSDSYRVFKGDSLSRL